MKLDKRFTPVCWIVLVLFSSSLLFARYSSLATGTSSAADIVILLVWIGLVTAPVFHELDLARSSLETHVDSLKAQVRKFDFIVPDTNPVYKYQQLSESPEGRRDRSTEKGGGRDLGQATPRAILAGASVPSRRLRFELSLQRETIS